jgi:hypothetical protein
MAHGHYRHSRIGKLHSARHREIVLNGGDSGSGLLKEVDPLQNSINPATDTLPDEDCDPSQNSICLEHKMNDSDALEKRHETTSGDGTVVETVLQVVDASSHILLQSTAADYPMTISDSVYGTFTISSSESMATTDSSSMTDSLSLTASLAVTASVEIALMTSPTLAPTTQPTTSLLPETSLSVAPTTSTQSTSNSTSQHPSFSIRVASAISSSVWASTPLIAPSSSTHTASITSPEANNYWSHSNPSSSSSAISTTSETYTTSSSSVYWGSENTATATSSSTPLSTSETQASGQGSSNNPDTPKIVGGVVGSVAGLALIILLLFYYLRRRGFFMGNKAHPAISDDAAAGAGIGASAAAGAAAGTREVAERRSSNEPLFTASYFAPAFVKRWRQSTATTRTDSTIDSTSSERSFQKISGRKLPPVLTHGGDGFGGGLDGDSPVVPGFFPTSPAGPVGSPSYNAPPPASPYGMPLDSNYTREIEEINSPPRLGPGQIPVSNSVNAAHSITVTPAQSVAQPQSAIPFIPPRPDGLGRSLHSYDGSRSSRFTEGIDM